MAHMHHTWFGKLSIVFNYRGLFRGLAILNYIRCKLTFYVLCQVLSYTSFEASFQFPLMTHIFILYENV